MTLSRRSAIKLTLAGSALAIPARAFADDDVKTLDIVFEGGGIKGAAFCGALNVLEARGFSYRHVIGTSAGAITAALIAAGYTSGEMQAILTKRDEKGNHVFQSFLLPPSAEDARKKAPPKSESFLDRMIAKANEKLAAASSRLFGSAKSVADGLVDKATHATGETKIQWDRMFALLSTGALASDAAFLAWLTEQIRVSPLLKPSAMSIDAVRGLTLRQFHDLTQAKGTQLSVVAADVTGMRVLVLNHHTAPGVPLVDAVRMSMGIPMVWPEVEWNKNWGPYRGKIEMWDRDNAGNRVVDGGVLSNFPLRYLIDPRHMKDDGVLGESAVAIKSKILGFLLDESLPIPGVDPVKEKENLATRLPAYRSLSRVMNAMTGAADQEAIDDSQREEIKKLGLGDTGPLCRIPVKGYQTLDFNMEPTRMEKLINSGKEAMEAYLARPVV